MLHVLSQLFFKHFSYFRKTTFATHFFFFKRIAMSFRKRFNRIFIFGLKHFHVHVLQILFHKAIFSSIYRPVLQLKLFTTLVECTSFKYIFYKNKMFNLWIIFLSTSNRNSTILLTLYNNIFKVIFYYISLNEKISQMH